jgi:hypothetical protein
LHKNKALLLRGFFYVIKDVILPDILVAAFGWKKRQALYWRTNSDL